MRLFSLREAPRRAGLPEETLRRAPLLGELRAEPVNGQRQYVIRGSDLEAWIARRDSAAGARAADRQKPASFPWWGLFLVSLWAFWISGLIASFWPARDRISFAQFGISRWGWGAKEDGGWTERIIGGSEEEDVQ